MTERPEWPIGKADCDLGGESEGRAVMPHMARQVRRDAAAWRPWYKIDMHLGPQSPGDRSPGTGTRLASGLDRSKKLR